MADLKRGIMSADHYFAIADSEGYCNTSGEPDNHPSRIHKNLKTMILPSSQNALVFALARACVAVKTDTVDGLERIAEDLAKMAGPNVLGYVPDFYADSARYMQVSDKMSNLFDALGSVIKGKEE